jgi:hypothetical protein
LVLAAEVGILSRELQKGAPPARPSAAGGGLMAESSEIRHR